MGYVNKGDIIGRDGTFGEAKFGFTKTARVVLSDCAQGPNNVLLIYALPDITTNF